jgi:hypothetical protein
VAKGNRLKVTRGHSTMHLKRRVGVLFLVLLLILPVVSLNAAKSSPQLIDLSTKKCSQQEYTYTAKDKKDRITSVVIDGTSVNLKDEGLEIVDITLNGQKVSAIYNPGTYTVTIKAKDGSKRFKGQTTLTVVVKKSKKAKIAKKDKKKIQKKTYKVSKDGKKKAKLKLKYQLITTKSKKGITYKITDKNKKYFKISKKGVITLKKNAKVKAGKTYKVTVKTVRKESKHYFKKVSKPIKIKIKVTDK